MSMIYGRLALLAALLILGTGTLHAQDPDLGTDAQREAGKVVYEQYCSQCHGVAGDAVSYTTAYLRPAPRNFTTGTYKFRSSANGELPSDEDIRRSIREGMPTTSMPAWEGVLSAEEITNTMYYIKSFADDFAGPFGIPEMVTIPNAPSFNEGNLERGRLLYEDNECIRCHGLRGLGNGDSAPTLEDDWGLPIRAADMTKRWTYRNGGERQDIYRTFTTGLSGSPMPAYDNIAEEDRWALVDYIYALSRDEPEYGTAVFSQAVQGELDLSQGKALFEGANPAYFAVVGQIIENGRAFFPGVDGIEVRAVHDQDDVAFLLTWHDMTAETTGHNSPALDAPLFVPANPDTLTGFSDAVAIQLPSETPAGVELPYFMFGDRKNSVDLWFADLAKGDAELFVGKGSGDIQPGESNLTVSSEYEDGEWNVLFSRKRAAETETGLSFDEGSFAPISFTVWDGFNEERGNKRGLTSWYYVYIEPLEQESAVGPMLMYGLLTLMLGLGLVFFTRRKYKNVPV